MVVPGGPSPRGRGAGRRATPLLAVGFAMVLFAACTVEGDRGASPTTTPARDGDPAAAGRTNEELARGSVQLLLLDAAGEPGCSGSGTLVDPGGTILTNFHVVENAADRGCGYERIGVAVTSSADEPPELRYAAEVHAVDPALDLAVLRISGGLDGGPAPDDLPFVGIGDSDALEVGDHLRVFGYPGIGGDTITFTEGSVAGFLPAPEVEGRAWIKTTTTIAGGNSGGTAVNDQGELVAVPTQVSAGDNTETVDCRILADTNGDGQTDSADTCVPTGGFLNGLRPVNLARALIEEAASAAAIPAAELTPEPVPGQDPGDGERVGDVTSMVFASGVAASGEPTEVAVALPSGAPELCAFFDYSGMVDGVPWDAIWTVDGEVDEGASIVGDTWSGGEQGSWWVCAVGDGALPDGLWELSVYTGGAEEPLATEGAYVGDDHPVVAVTIANRLDEAVCFLYVSPSASRMWGMDELGADVTLPPGQEVTVEVGAADYDVLATDCEGQTLAEDYSVDLTQPSRLTLG